MRHSVVVAALPPDYDDDPERWRSWSAPEGSAREVWRDGRRRIAEFDSAALAYDRFRPRYPPSLFADLLAAYGMKRGLRAVEIGAGTGIATLPLVECGFEVTAIEPAAAMAELLEAKVAGRARVVVSRFEDAAPERGVGLVAAFNSWHWVDPRPGVDRLVETLRPGGVVALVWTEVISWGEDPFTARLAEVSGHPWDSPLPEIVDSKDVVATDERFTPIGQRRYRFERPLDARSFVEVTRTYGGHLSEPLLLEVEALIHDEFGGTVTKVEEAALHAYRLL